MNIFFKLILIIIIIIIFYLFFNRNIEKFFIDNYRNINTYPWDRDNIYSSLPIDIKSKYESTYFYEFSNNEFEKKLNEIFKKCDINDIITILDGNTWSNWINPKESNYKSKILDYYNKIYDYINYEINNSDLLKLPNNSKNKINIIKDKLIQYKFNKNNKEYLLFDIELLLHRINKPLGKHIKMIVVSNNIDIYVIYSKIIGIVNENNIITDNIKEYDDNFKYNEFLPDKNTKNNLNSYIYLHDENLLNSEINKNIYDKLLEPYIINSSDVMILNNSDFIDNYYNNNSNFTNDMIKVRNSFLDKLK